MHGHSSTAITEQVSTSVLQDVVREVADSAAALIPRAQRLTASDAGVPTVCPPVGRVGAGSSASEDETADRNRWAGGARTLDPGIMSAHALCAVLTCIDAARQAARRGQSHHRDQAREQHQVVITERGARAGRVQ